ncbi:MAG: efflux RND transporter periplasmic adaptor subunit [Acidobacteriota bacterium]
MRSPFLFPLFFLLALAASCNSGPDVPRGPKVLEWAEAGPGEVMRVVEAQGVVRARDKAFIRVGSRLKGQILKMHVRTGDVVRAGQLLAELDDRELQTQRRQAQARLDSARNELARLEALKPKRLEEARAALSADQGRSEYAAGLNRKRQTLRDSSHIPQSDLDLARRDAKAAAQAVIQDRLALGRIEKEFEHDLERATKAVNEAQAAVAQVDAFLSMTRVESPIDAIVGQVLTQEGELVVAEVETVKILTLIDPGFLELWIYINEADAAGVRPGMPVRFFMPSKKQQVMLARVERVSPAPELVDKVLYYPVMALLGEQAGLLLRPEMNVQCYVQVENLTGVLSVPNEAVVAQGGKRLVYLDDGRGGTTEVQPVFGVRGLQRTQVLSGLEPGARVAVKFDGR